MKIAGQLNSWAGAATLLLISATAILHAEAQELSTVKIATIRSDGLAAIDLGIKKGFFEKQGLKAEFNYLQAAGPASIASVISGKDQFAIVGYGTVMTAISKGVPLVAIGAADGTGAKPEQDRTRIFTTTATGIAKAKQLEGKKVGVNGLGGLPTAVVAGVVMKDGGDWRKVNLVAVPFPQGPTALERGMVDAIHTTEPFLSVARDALGDKLVDLGGTVEAFAPNAPIQGWFVLKSYYDANRDLVRRMQEAIQESYVYATAHPDEMRAFMSNSVGASAEILNKIIWPVYPLRTDLSFIKVYQDLYEEVGLLEKGKLPPAEQWIMPNPFEKKN